MLGVYIGLMSRNASSPPNRAIPMPPRVVVCSFVPSINYKVKGDTVERFIFVIGRQHEGAIAGVWLSFAAAVLSDTCDCKVN